MKQNDIIFILISLTFVVGAWIVFNVLHNSLTSTISQTTAANIAPIPGTFDVKTLDALQKRTVVNPQNGIATTPSPTPSPTPVPLTPVAPLNSQNVGIPTIFPTPTPTVVPLTPVSPL